MSKNIGTPDSNALLGIPCWPFGVLSAYPKMTYQYLTARQGIGQALSCSTKPWAAQLLAAIRVFSDQAASG